MGTTSPANCQIFPLQPHYSAPAQNNRNKNPTTLHLYLLVQWLSFKSNTKPLGFLFAFMASTSTSKPGHLLVLAWDKSLVTKSLGYLMLQLLLQKVNNNKRYLSASSISPFQSPALSSSPGLRLQFWL